MLQKFITLITIFQMIALPVASASSSRASATTSVDARTARAKYSQAFAKAEASGWIYRTTQGKRIGALDITPRSLKEGVHAFPPLSQTFNHPIAYRVRGEVRGGNFTALIDGYDLKRDPELKKIPITGGEFTLVAGQDPGKQTIAFAERVNLIGKHLLAMSGVNQARTSPLLQKAYDWSVPSANAKEIPAYYYVIGVVALVAGLLIVAGTNDPGPLFIFAAIIAVFVIGDQLFGEEQ